MPVEARLSLHPCGRAGSWTFQSPESARGVCGVKGVVSDELGCAGAGPASEPGARAGGKGIKPLGACDACCTGGGCGGGGLETPGAPAAGGGATVCDGKGGGVGCGT